MNVITKFLIDRQWWTVNVSYPQTPSLFPLLVMWFDRERKERTRGQIVQGVEWSPLTTGTSIQFPSGQIQFGTIIWDLIPKLRDRCSEDDPLNGAIMINKWATTPKEIRGEWTGTSRAWEVREMSVGQID